MSLNKVMLIGNIGKDPEIRYLDGNVKVATFSLATTEKYKDRQGNTKEMTEWHNIVAWRNLADIVEKYMTKGRQVYVEGRLRTRDWTDQSGNKRYSTDIIADTVQLLGQKIGERQDIGGTAQYIAGARQITQQQAPASNPAPARTPLYQQAQQMTQNQTAPVVVDNDIIDTDDLPF